MKAQIVSFHCILKNTLGQVISTSFNRDVITHLPQGEVMEVPALAAGLQEVKPGEHREISISADQAYGLYNPELTRTVSREQLSSTGTPTVGDRVHLADEHGNYRLYRITKILGDFVYLDANHPLAGQDLIFDIQVVDARDATAEEILESSAPSRKEYLQ
jgi:FKBP-type peptidyl-prolyl cis-trans isomerase SlyD